ncbi:Tetratricopeptide repeat-containing protein putative isoform 1 [Tripterygium wilfordii]|uniref:Tetratricopeptide repeat-containing protein putative isoform 1 n=1 Tax=Tripterygium wilfordii TaxID=458696 RepID=A0A7J7C296_TRIWF|nr:general transcription factor 3C polypeptide 3 [Tripterygium wilfordii]KAF5728289.1 Tetratricopeptide repeat-containing protein putative isoform 1 [Tripterygium wilfordii]
MESNEKEISDEETALDRVFDSSNNKGDEIDEEDEEEDENDDDDDEVEEEGDEEEEELPFRFFDDEDGDEYDYGSGPGVQSYEALAEKKRKALLDPSQRDSFTKKARQEDIPTEVMNEMMEAMMGYGFRRKSRKTKKRGRRKGSKSKVSPEITQMMGEATLHYAQGHYKEAISILCEVVRRAPHLSDPYHTLGLVHSALGNSKKAKQFYLIAAFTSRKDSPLWKSLFDWFIEQRSMSQASYCLDRAVKVDPGDISLKHRRASLYIELGDYQRAAESYEKIVELCPDNVESLMNAAKLYLKCGQSERSVDILAKYLKDHPSEANISVISLLAAVFMEINAHNNALELIENVQLVYYLGKELPLTLKIKAGICHVHLGNVEKAEILFSVLQRESASDHAKFVTEVAGAFVRFEHFELALKYYHILEENDVVGDARELGHLHLHIARCYFSLRERGQAIKYFYKALHTLEDNVDARLHLASLLLEDTKEEEAIVLLSPPENLDSVDPNSDEHEKWWNDAKIKLKLCQIYRAKEMIADFIEAILPSIHESLYCESLRQKYKARKRLRMSELLERIKKVDDQQADDIFRGIRPIVPPNDRVKASRARKLLQKKAALEKEKKALAKDAGVDVKSDDSDDELMQKEVRMPPLPNLLTDEEHYKLIIDLCKALASLQRYWEALEIINLTQKLAHNSLSVEKKQELQSLGAQISYNTTDPKNGFDCVRCIVQQRPHSISAWNCYYKVASRLAKGYSKHYKFQRHMRSKYNDCVPPIIISGHQFTVASHHQDAAREYLEAYKLLPENPLINLCVGTALINLALGFRLQNKHQCVAQGLAFLHNNLRLCEHSQEALYNIARAYHHVGLVTLAVLYYEKVLATREKDYPIPRLPNENADPAESQKSGYCDLRREAAYNLHLIYKKSGAVDLARQILKDHCTI